MSRRQEDLGMKASYMTSRDRRNDLGHDSYVTSRGGVREEQPLRSRRSFSPHHTLEGTRRTVVRDQRSNSLERRREYEQHVGRVHDDRMLSSSPPIERVQRRHLDERAFNLSPTSTELRRNYEYSDFVDYNNMNSRSKHSHSYDECFEVGKEEDYIERRSGTSGHGAVVQNSISIEDAMDREGRLRPNYGFASRYGEASGSYSTADMYKFKDENTRYQDALHHEKLPKGVYYKDGDNFAYYSRGSPYIESSLSQLKDFENEDMLKSVPGSSSILARGEYSGKGRDVRSLPSEGYPKSYERGAEPLFSDDYDQRTVPNPRRGYEPEHRDTKCHTCDAYASARAEHKDHMYPEVNIRLNDDPSYSHHRNMYEKMTYGHGGHDHRSLLGPDIMDGALETTSKNDDSHFSRRIVKNNGVRELQKDVAQDYVDMRRSSDALKQVGDYLDYGYTHVELTKKMSNHRHTAKFDGLHEHGIDDSHSGYGYGRYAPARSDRTRMKSSPESKNEMDLQRLVGGSERTKAEEPVVYERGLKRKYSMDDEIRRVDSRNLVPTKWSTRTRAHDFDDDLVEWTSRKSSGVHSNRPSGYEQNRYYTEAEQVFDEAYCHKESTNARWISYHDQSKSIQDSSGKPFKTGTRYFKGYTKSESSKSYSHMHHSHQKSTQYKQQNLRQRNEDNNHIAVHAKDIDPSEDTGGPWKSDPIEESEGFKQRVQAAFLDFSKRFNENPTARKLYKEQGKAGSLFCIVCRRSGSKEFLDTRALATHAFMSHKVGLRPQHLGLHKAICVLMGWNNMPDCDSGTWVPENLPRAEALARKEDLILWPPAVIIHNISLSSNDHNEWKLINIEALGNFLRAKGFSLGKMKICLGNPGDNSVILVKFLSTFSGLQEAERLHKYFLERKHGRVDFELAISSIAKIDDLKQGSDDVDQLEDVLLYGYMGISEDLDRVDFDTKKKCLVKSKKEIHDLADAPVKPE